VVNKTVDVINVQTKKSKKEGQKAQKRGAEVSERLKNYLPKFAINPNIILAHRVNLSCRIVTRVALSTIKPKSLLCTLFCFIAMYFLYDSYNNNNNNNKKCNKHKAVTSANSFFSRLPAYS